ncbi:MAG: amidohydrolase family protein [Myxococcota bacterium]|nr:amidohydrolase family protein [Myxococcota bacterium]
MLDRIIRGGEVIDGTGAPGKTADVGIRDGRIVSVGQIDEPARETLSADGLMVTPGWVDVHTHYDGQVTWDGELTPSSVQGVTTAVMGNCGVGFAPAAPDRHDWLISLMEGVEDIPGTALAEGIEWQWESFPEYLDAVESRSLAIDVGAQVPHGALRAYVMGERGADHRVRPDPEEISRMGRLAREAIEAGALGFTSSRTRNHRTKDGEPTPSLTAGPEEMLGIAEEIGRGGLGVFEIVADFADLEDEFKLLRKMVEISGRPMSISVAQNDRVPDQWRRLLDQIGEAAEVGLPMKAQVAPRAIGLLLGLEASLHPFIGHPTYQSIKDLSREEKWARLKDPNFRAALLTEQTPEMLRFLVGDFERLFLLGDPPNYEPSPDQSLAAEARRRGVSEQEWALECLLEQEGRALLYRPFLNYTEFNLDSTRDMLLDPNAVPGLGDAGAHCGMICDGSFPTYLLSHWGRDRTRGERLEVPWLVQQQTSATAQLVGLQDRGVIAPGMRADLNLIEWDKLRLCPPEIVFDLPAGGRRLVQRAEGYQMTLVAGQPICESGQLTGARPGRLIRGAQGCPA